MMIEDAILEYINSNKIVTRKTILKAFEVDKFSKGPFIKTLENMNRDGKIYIDKKERIHAIDNISYAVGEISKNEKGFGFLLMDDGEDVFIPSEFMGSTVNKDTVLVKIDKVSSGEKREGKILRIIKRNATKFVGTFQSSRDFGFVVPDDKKVGTDIFIRGEDINGAEDGQKVVAKIKKWAEKDKKPEGEITEILGFPEEPYVDVESIAKSFDIATKFPKKVLNEAKYMPKEPTERQLEGRHDLTDMMIYTIDGADSKDFDDAISIEKVGDIYRLGVHIADVSQYVKEDSYLDKEAFKRGNSYYLQDKVYPMLPKELSNGICSLNEGVVRLTLSVFMEIDKKGKVVEHKIEESFIKSKRRLVYDNVSDYLEEGKKHPSLEGLYDSLDMAKELAEILMKKRYDRGSIDFDFKEPEIITDENGVPIDILVKDRRIGNKIIEEFMICANETVAEEYYWLELPFLYRIHEEPDEEDVERLNSAIRHLGLSINNFRELRPVEFRNIIDKVKGTSEELFVSTLLLRSLQKARYSEVNDIHFGLASKYYSHFTSPIRRYADLFIHRIIKANLTGLLSRKKIEYYDELSHIVAEQTSKMERVAQACERKVESVKMAEYMKDRIGEKYSGIIVSITSFGMFVQLENLVEGLVPYKTMDGFYEMDENNYTAVANDREEVYHMGDMVNVVVVNSNITTGEIDFELESIDGREGTCDQ